MIKLKDLLDKELFIENKYFNSFTKAYPEANQIRPILKMIKQDKIQVVLIISAENMTQEVLTEAVRIMLLDAIGGVSVFKIDKYAIVYSKSKLSNSEQKKIKKIMVFNNAEFISNYNNSNASTLSLN